MLLVPEHASPVKNVGGPTTTDSDNQKWDDVTMCPQKICVHVIHYIALLHIVTLFAVAFTLITLFTLHTLHTCILYILSIYNYVHILPKMSTRIRKTQTQGAFQDPGVVLHAGSLPRCLGMIPSYHPWIEDSPYDIFSHDSREVTT